MPARKLTPGEISSSVEKIRKRYDEYISKFFKPKSLREAFEARYIKALRGGIDVSSFLLAEISAIEELIHREEQRVLPARPGRPRQRNRALRTRCLRRTTSGSRSIPRCPSTTTRGRRCAGWPALSVSCSRTHWPDLSAALHDTMYAMSSSEMLSLDSQLRYLAPSNREETPQFLSRLMAQLRKFPRNYPSIEREEKEYILEAAFFLNELFTVLERVKRVYTEMREEHKKKVDETMAYVWAAISDFRLKDFKRKKRWEHDES